jgi:outer membrane protein insertion porin family
VYRLELFQFVNIRALAEGQNGNQIPIEVRVSEAPLYTLKVGAGYGSEELFRATLYFRRRNFLGGARRLEAELKYSDIEPGKIQLRLFQPHFFDPRTTLIFSPFYLREVPKVVIHTATGDSLGNVKTTTSREPIYSLRSAGVELTALRQINWRTSGYLRYRLENAKVTPGTAPDTTVEIPQSYRKATWGFGWFYNSSWPLFSPERGRYNSLQIDYSGPLSEWFFLHAEFHYVKPVVEMRWYRKVMPRLVIANRLKIGTIEVLDDSLNFVPVEERFYAGGSASVRGWQRSQLGPQATGTPVGGQSLLEGSAEGRFKIVGSFGTALFLDFGNVWSTTLTYKLNELYYGAGIGWRYETPIGPIRFDAAYKLNRQEFDTQGWEFYTSVGQAF